MLGVTSYEESRNRKNLANSISANDGITDVDRRDKAEVCVVCHWYVSTAVNNWIFSVCAVISTKYR